MKHLPAALAAAFLLCILSAGALAWQTPAFGDQYDRYYEDDTIQVAVKNFTGEKLSYWVADVQLTDASQFETITGPHYRTVSDYGEEANAILAINADDYVAQDTGIIIRNGEILRSIKTNRETLILHPDGTLTTETRISNFRKPEILQSLTDEGVQQTFAFGPILVQDGKAVDFPHNFDAVSIKPRHLDPRTAIGMYEPLHYLVIVADGRQPEYSNGMSLKSLQDLFLSYGVTMAFNLDGGGSSEMWFRGEVLNKPSGGSERKVSEAICFCQNIEAAPEQ